MSKDDDDDLRVAQLGLVRWQLDGMSRGQKVVIVFEGRDAAGKDGTIKRLTEHLSVRNTRVVALPKPSERDRSQWYFQRYVEQLPAAGETVIFNRSWYNRAGVERVMGFSSAAEQEQFLQEVPIFEAMLVRSGVTLVKLWLDVSRAEQARRLKERATDPLKALKASPLDAEAQARWDAYSRARDEMLVRTDHAAAPWICVRADDKSKARVAILRRLVHTLAPPQVASQVPSSDPDILFAFRPEAIRDGRLQP